MTGRLFVATVWLLFARVGIGAQHCGTERWDVKTLQDPLASSIDFRPVAATIKDLTAIEAPPKITDDARRGFEFPYEISQEFHVYEVVATVSCAKVEADRDVHVCLTDGAAHMIAESPDPRCISLKSPYVHDLAAARLKLLALLSGKDLAHLKALVGKKVRVRGVGFVDKLHGQQGVAPNGMELHPVLGIEAVR